jgi:trigger factor
VSISKEFTRLEKSNVKLTIIVPVEDIRKRYNAMIMDYTKKIQIPGFRKGKVPKEVLEQKFGKDLKNEAMGHIVEDSLREVFTDESLTRSEKPLPYSTPEMQDKPDFDLEQEFKFSVIYDVLPEIKINQWKGLTYEAPWAEVEDEDINRELDIIRERVAVVSDRNDTDDARLGDVVTVDYSVFDGENQKENRKDFAFTLGSGNNGYNFDNDIVGMKINEVKEFEKTYPRDYVDLTLAEKTLKFIITLNQLKEKTIPDLDDDFAQDVDEKYKTLNDLINSIRLRLTTALDQQLIDIKKHELLKKIMENSPVVLPESMITLEIDNRYRRFARMYNMSYEKYMQLIAAAPEFEKLEGEIRTAVEQALHSRVIIESLIEECKFDATDDEISSEYNSIAEKNNIPLDEVKEYYKGEERQFLLKEDIKERKITGLLLSENTCKQGQKKKYPALFTDNG